MESKREISAEEMDRISGGDGNTPSERRKKGFESEWIPLDIEKEGSSGMQHTGKNDQDVPPLPRPPFLP